MWTRSPPRIGRVTFDNGPVNLLDPVLNRALDTELAEHLGYEKRDLPGRRSTPRVPAVPAVPAVTAVTAVTLNTPPMIITMPANKLSPTAQAL